MSTSSPPPGPDERRSAWLDGELPDAGQRELEAELARDPSLRAELDALESVVRLVRAEAPTVAPPGFHQRVMARVAESREAAAPPGLLGWMSAWLRRWEAIALVGAAAAALVLVVPFAPSPDPDDPSPAAAPTGAARATASEPYRPGQADPGQADPGQVAAAPTDAAPPMPGATQVVGRARVEPPPPAGAGLVEQVRNGTNLAWEPAPVADGVVGAAPGSGRFVVSSDDPALRRQVVDLAARYGSVRDPRGRPVDAAAFTGTEDVLVTVSQAELPALARGLEGLGFDVGQLPSDLPPGAEVELRLVQEVPPAPRAARPAGDAGENEARPASDFE